MKNLIVILSLLVLTGCASLFAPPSGTHYTLKYGEVEVVVDDWTDREGVEFEYVSGDTTVTLKKKSVDTATPVAVLQAQQAENQAKALDVINKLVKP